MARGLSSEWALRKRPSDHLPFVSFAQVYGARPEGASLSFAFLLNLPRYGARPVLGASTSETPFFAQGHEDQAKTKRTAIFQSHI